MEETYLEEQGCLMACESYFACASNNATAISIASQIIKKKQGL